MSILTIDSIMNEKTAMSGCMEVRPNLVKRSGAKSILGFLQSVQADSEDVRRHIEREGAICGNGDSGEVPFGIVDQIIQTISAIIPQERLPPFKNDNQSS